MGKEVQSKLLLFFFKGLFIFRQRGREREGEKHQCVIVSCAPPMGSRVRNPLVHRPELNPLSYTSQGESKLLNASPLSSHTPVG